MTRQPAVDCTVGSCRDEWCRSARYLSASFFSFAHKDCCSATPGHPQRKGALQTSVPPLMPCAGQPSFTPNKRPLAGFLDRTGDNVDKSTVLRKNFHSPGVFLESGERSARSARTHAPRWQTVEEVSEDWYRYCIERMIGGIETGVPVSQVRIRLHPRLLHLVASEEAVKEMETDGSHSEKGIQQP